jgi:hypothetical protein
MARRPVVETPQNPLVELNAVQRMSRDVAQAGATLSDEEAGFLVSQYYSWQEKRKSSVNQRRSLVEKEVPHSIIEWSMTQDATMEAELKKALDKYTDAHPVGKWMKSQYGIGPVISAGLLAWFDIKKAPVVSHFYRIAGIEPGVKWDKASEMIKDIRAHISEFNVYLNDPSAREARKVRIREIAKANYECDVAPATAYDLKVYGQTFKLVRDRGSHGELRLLTLEYLRLSAIDRRELIDGTRFEEVKSPEGVTHDTVRWAALYFGRNPDTLLRLMAPKDNPGEIKWTMEALASAVSRIPYNPELRTLCWKIGQSFMKFSNREQCFYGKLYRERKAYENEQNQLKQYAALARRNIERFRKETEAYTWLTQDMLPPAHIDARARRYAVKIFLSHVHHVWYRHEFKKDPPLPFPIAHRGHVHMIEVPPLRVGDQPDDLEE